MMTNDRFCSVQHAREKFISRHRQGLSPMLIFIFVSVFLAGLGSENTGHLGKKISGYDGKSAPAAPDDRIDTVAFTLGMRYHGCADRLGNNGPHGFSDSLRVQLGNRQQRTGPRRYGLLAPGTTDFDAGRRSTAAPV